MPKSQCYRQKNTAILSNHEGGGIAIICAEPGKKSKNSDERTSWNQGRAERARSSPACCREGTSYPAGYTVFECRLDGKQPIAQVVQVPPDTRDNGLQNKTCMILETKQSEFGPSSRVAAYPGPGSPSRSSCNRGQAQGPMSFALETRDHPRGAVAYASKIAEQLSSSVSQAQPITLLETSTACPNGPTSRLTYGPVATPTASSKTYKPSAFYIHCTTTPEGPVARVTQVPQDSSKCSGDSLTRYETVVGHDGNCPTATVTQCNEKGKPGHQQACEYIETTVCPSGPCAKAMCLPQGSSNVRHLTHLDVRPRNNGPIARISQHPADPQMTVLNLRDHRGKTAVCCCDPIVPQVPRVQCPRKVATTTCNAKRPVNGVKSVVERRNGLTPTSSELDGRVGPFKYSKLKRGRIGDTAQVCPPCCRQIFPLPDLTSPVCRTQPTSCVPQKSQKPDKTPKTPLLLATSCLCPLQPCFKALARSRNDMHPLPGGARTSQCPAPALPDIAPVPLGPNRLRDYKPRPKTTGLQKGKAPPRRPPVVDDKISNPVKTTEQEKDTNEKKTKNKKTGSRKRSEEVSLITDQNGDKVTSQVDGKTNTEDPDLVSTGNQADAIQREPVYVQCPAYASRGDQSIEICKEPAYVECPAYESKRKKSVARIEEPSYVRCPAFATKTSSDSSSIYVPREDLLISKYPEYFRGKTVETYMTCRAKRNGLQDECHLHIPECVLRMNYEQRRNRHARTLVSSCRRRRRFDDECERIPETRYCARSELPVQ